MASCCCSKKTAGAGDKLNPSVITFIVAYCICIPFKIPFHNPHSNFFYNKKCKHNHCFIPFSVNRFNFAVVCGMVSYRTIYLFGLSSVKVNHTTIERKTNINQALTISCMEVVAYKLKVKTLRVAFVCISWGSAWVYGSRVFLCFAKNPWHQWI